MWDNPQPNTMSTIEKMLLVEQARHAKAILDIFALSLDATDSEASSIEEVKVEEAKVAEVKVEKAKVEEVAKVEKAKVDAPKKSRKPKKAAHPAEMVGTTVPYDGGEYRITNYISEAASHVQCALFDVENVATGKQIRLKSSLFF